MYQDNSSIDYRAIFESNPIGNLILSPSFHIVAVTDAYLRMTMTTRESLIGVHLFTAFPDNPEDKNASGVSQLRTSLERVLLNKKTDSMAIQRYDVVNPETGEFEERFWSPMNAPVFDAAGEVKYIIHKAEDVTTFVKLKNNSYASQSKEGGGVEDKLLERVRQTQRMEAMGQLAGGVAHDFNNILAIILISCEMFSKKYKNFSNEGMLKIIEQIKSGAIRAGGLTKQLLAFSRKQVLQPQVVSINDIIPGLVVMLGRLLPESIRLVNSLSEDLNKTCIDPGQVEQIIMNLVVNARDAMPNGGQITIETKNEKLDSAMANGNIKVEPGDYVMVAVRDTGHGMDAATQARIFEPFFTTKEVGKGTGLGLATVYGIVAQHKGTIWVYSEIEKGSVFKVYLPTTEVKNGAKEAELASDSFLGDHLTGKEKILVVEDQEELRWLVEKSFADMGYNVKSAVNGAEAFKIIEMDPFAFDLIITDVIMPEMNGNILAKKTLKLNPKAKFLFLSGYTEGELSYHGFSEKSFHFIEKPFSMSEVLEEAKKIILKE